MTQTGKVHFLTRIPGRKEVHLLGNADLTTSFKVLKHQLGSLWRIDDMSNCVLEYSGSMLKASDDAIMIGTDEEWTFAREQFCKHVDAQPASKELAKVPTTGYVSATGYCYYCKVTRTPACSICPNCRCAAIAAPADVDAGQLIEPISILIRRRPGKPTAAELDALSEDEKAAKINALTTERDALLLSTTEANEELKVQRAALQAQASETDKAKAAHKAQSDVLMALAAAYLRETGKAFTLKGINEQFKASEKAGAGSAPSASSVGGFDVVDDGESTA